ncbi:sulfite exporter TauE/SafE family protein [Polynucleobacter sp. AP-Kaivos-20-H2]|uniref:sulfite exporter TauE/SafE family protein n=1 Tax=Polynucleobacter sp. AP-Kaivos-20-H2 TaxID=2689104 RepID=UPI001C0A9746|nr:sulfite exporter TauE/SafE family protein [Polynucleobacter sp. AP-Kaivos-20-H2]MBU3604902.1 sulfite exporter TauE/SafE family protein [Polynucleobacter sp. AP-Kaivos-20-H2]
MLDLLFTSLEQSFHAHSLAFFVCAVISVTILGISKSGFGAGLGTLSLPLMASQAPINEALAIMLPLLIVIDLVGLRRYIQNANWGILKIVIPPAIAGLLLGMIFFTAITPQVLTLSIGIFTLLFLIQNLAMSRIEAKETKSYPWLGRAMGLTSGFTSFVAHIGGPPITVYMLREKLLPMVYTSTLGVFFTVMNFGKLGPYAYLDLLNYKQLATSIILLPCAPVGVYFGFYLAKRISMKWYYRTVRFFLLIASIKLISDGLI